MNTCGIGVPLAVVGYFALALGLAAGWELGYNCALRNVKEELDNAKANFR